MDDDDLDYFRNVVDDRLIEVSEELEKIGDATDPISPDKSIDRLSRLDAMQMQEMAREQERRLKKKKDRLEETLRRIESKSFGQCSSCGRPIEFQRLQASPDAMTCSRCVAKYA